MVNTRTYRPLYTVHLPLAVHDSDLQSTSKLPELQEPRKYCASLKAAADPIVLASNL